jgi:acyl-coenzyme A synthetase/AMP-(fatty) acid ligase
LRDGVRGDDALAQALKDHVRTRLARHLYPRGVSFIDAMPRTVTGKTRRDVLRELGSAAI